jgi:zinc/manganese transport system permease protein
MSLLASVFGPGFFTNAPVQVAVAIGGGAAIVSAVAGVFTLMRGHAFAGHALAEISSAGGSASFLLGVNPLLGFALMAMLGAGGIELIGRGRARERSLATGIVLAAGLGLAALFLHFDMTMHGTAGAPITVMFGSMWAIPVSIIPWAIGAGLSALLAVGVLYRPLLLSAIDPDLAQLRGIDVRLVGLLHLAVLALAVSLAAITIGAILATALLIGPAAIGLRLASRPAAAICLSVLISLGATLSGIVLAYDSFYWTPGHGWPVSFFIVMLVFVLYIALVHLPERRAGARRLPAPGQSAGG